MRTLSSISLMLFLALLPSLLLRSSAAADNGDDCLRIACNVTEYPDLCFTKLSSWPNTVKRSWTGLARAAISVTVTETKNVSRYILGLRNVGLTGTASMALVDCIECFGDALDNLYRSLFQIRVLENDNFKFQVSNMQTWLSAAMSSEETCVDGLNGSNGSNGTALVQGLNTAIGCLSKVTSIALALVNTLNSTDGHISAAH
ncbi:pectinesterase inhibitor 6-like [Nymphaea colorata]|uniref:Pectinesterase inhibitor domain-containing protein n=1 Tax=Nymphaea colorata TaxID=210225 RepID=A0A5K1DK20_9MAGN|nr:pectinesterase inhibitor 6-like [Nymphaea colorata]